MLDFRGLVDVLEARGELRRIKRTVDRQRELPALMEQVDRERRAYYFEHVEGARFPLVGGLLNRYDVYGWALDVPPGEPFTRADLDARTAAARARPLPAVEVADGPVRECVLRGSEIDLGLLPVPTMFELDSGPFITGACGVTRDPTNGALNVGVYRTLVLGRDSFSANASATSDLRQIYDAAARRGEPLPIALVIGADPALLMAAVCKLPRGESEYALAGALRGEPLPLVRCLTSDLLVPAFAEIVIEAVVEPVERIANTLGEWSGLYATDKAPVARVTAITHRRDARFYQIFSGRNPEHTTLASVTAFEFQHAVGDALRAALPGVRDLQVFADHDLGSMLHVAIAIDKQDDAAPLDLALAAFRAEVSMGGARIPCERVVKRVIVVDADVDVHDRGDVEWALWTRTARADKFRVLGETPSWDLERCAKPGRGSLRLAIDATSDLEDRDKLQRAQVRERRGVRLADYLAG